MNGVEYMCERRSHHQVVFRFDSIAATNCVFVFFGQNDLYGYWFLGAHRMSHSDTWKEFKNEVRMKTMTSGTILLVFRLFFSWPLYPRNRSL